MGDAGEGLVDADARIQERLEEVEAARNERAKNANLDPEKAARELSRQLVVASLKEQLKQATHPVRRAQLEAALKDIDSRT